MNVPSNAVRLSVALGIAALLLGISAATAQKTPGPSGFLSDYSRLAEDPEEKGSRLIYRNPSYRMADFEGLYLEELKFMLYPADEAVEIDAEEAARMLELAKRFDDVLREELAKQGARLVAEAAPGVLHCRWAVTNLGKSKSAMRVIPQARVMGSLTGAGRGGAAMEGECFDGGSGDLVAQIVRADKGAKKSGVTTWAGAESAIREWGEGLAARMAAKRKDS